MARRRSRSRPRARPATPGCARGSASRRGSSKRPSPRSSTGSRRDKAPSYGSVHVQTDDLDGVIRAVRQFVPRMPGGSKGSVVAPPRNGWIGVYDELADRNPEMLRRLAREISDRMGAVVLLLGVEEGQVVRFVLLERGRTMDEYLSVPEYYGEVPPGDVISLAANPTVVARLTGAGLEAGQPARTLSQPVNEGNHGSKQRSGNLHQNGYNISGNAQGVISSKEDQIDVHEDQSRNCRFLRRGFAVHGCRRIGRRSRLQQRRLLPPAQVYSEVLSRVRSEYVEEPNIPAGDRRRAAWTAGIARLQLQLSDAPPNTRSTRPTRPKPRATSAPRSRSASDMRR